MLSLSPMLNVKFKKEMHTLAQRRIVAILLGAASAPMRIALSGP